MRIISLVSQKGGSGKTTLAGHIAIQAERMDLGPVALLDADPQENLADWLIERHAETPIYDKTSLWQLDKHVVRFRHLGIKLVVVDTPPGITELHRKIIGISDIVVVPARPSPHDLRALGKTVTMIEDQAKPLAFVLNGASSRARITSETVLALSQHGTVAPVILHQRANFASSMIDGRTVMETDRRSRSTAEIAQLTQYLKNRLNKDRTTLFAKAPYLDAPRPVTSERPAASHTASPTEAPTASPAGPPAPPLPEPPFVQRVRETD
jgi:chromosome partitioning protein